MRCSIVFIVSFDHVCVCWVLSFYTSIVFRLNISSLSVYRKNVDKVEYSTKWNAQGVAKIVKGEKSSKIIDLIKHNYWKRRPMPYEEIYLSYLAEDEGEPKRTSS